jgi:GntR family transcriptional regulator
MLFQIDASSMVPIYAQIVGQVRAGVASGTLRAGDPLPSARQLASELRVNPNTVAQAYRELDREGLTTVQRGQGTFVAALANGRREEERARVARDLVERMLAEAARIGVAPADLRRAVDEAMAPDAAPAGGPAR